MALINRNACHAEILALGPENGQLKTRLALAFIGDAKMKRILHITNNLVACKGIDSFASSDAASVYIGDKLSLGPLDLGDDFIQLIEHRRVYWTSFWSVLGDSPSRPRDDACSGFLELAALSSGADEIYLWACPSLDDQLLLISAATLLERHGFPLDKIRVVPVRSHPTNKVAITTLGQLDTDALQSALYLAERITDENMRSYRAAWQAVTNSDPSWIETLDSMDGGARSELVRALSLLKHRFPALDSGLPRYLLTLCQAVRKHGPRLSMIIGHAIGDQMTECPLDRVEDLILWASVMQLSVPFCKCPLLSVAGDASAMFRVDVELTEAGKQVIAGKESNIQLNGIDCWIGGTHLLTGRAPMWYHDSTRDQLVEK